MNAVVALTSDQSIVKAPGLARGENVYSVIAVGWPDEDYDKIIPRYTNMHS